MEFVMKKLIFASLLAFPLMASAGFVDDCKTAYVTGDLGVQIMERLGGSIDQKKAEKPFESRCSCISKEVNSSNADAFVNFIQNRFTSDMNVVRVVRQCESEVTKVERKTFVDQRQKQINACLEREILSQKGTEQDKIYARRDLKYAQDHDGDWNGDIEEEHFRGRDIATKAMYRCY